jgi:dihydrofolate reductase
LMLRTVRPGRIDYHDLLFCNFHSTDGEGRLLKVSVYIATSLDGFIARENGEIDWLPGDGSDGTDEDYGYREFIDTVDALVMGRHTFEKALTFKEWPYLNKPVIVLSSKGFHIPESIADVKLRHIETRQYESGLVQSRYEIE